MRINTLVTFFVCGSIVISGSIPGVYVAIMNGDSPHIALASLVGGGVGLIISTLVVIVWDKVHSRIASNQAHIEAEHDISSSRNSESGRVAMIPLQIVAHPSPRSQSASLIVPPPLIINSLTLTNEEALNGGAQLRAEEAPTSPRRAHSF